MAGEPVPPPTGPDEREARLTLIRKQAEQFGRVDASGVRPPGAPFPHASPETGYYGVPLLKPPQWTWEIPLYFFVGGALFRALPAINATAITKTPTTKINKRFGRLKSIFSN